MHGSELSMIRRVSGLAMTCSTGVKYVGSSIYYALGVTTVYAQGGSFLAIGTPGLLKLVLGLGYAPPSSRMGE